VTHATLDAWLGVSYFCVFLVPTPLVLRYVQVPRFISYGQFDYYTILVPYVKLVGRP